MAVAMVQTKHLRPLGFPKSLGRNFFLTGYRYFVRHKTNDGKNQRGLYILRSETDSAIMETLGNIFTHYNYSKIDISVEKNENTIRVHSPESGLEVEALINEERCPLPPNSPFNSWKEARAFCGPMPNTFSVDQETITTIKGQRQNWNPRPTQILQYRIPFLDRYQFANPVLANAFIVEKIKYKWSRGIQNSILDEA